MLPDVGNQQPGRRTQHMIIEIGILHIKPQCSRAVASNPEVDPERAVVPFHERVLLRDVRRVDPGLDGESC